MVRPVKKISTMGNVREEDVKAFRNLSSSSTPLAGLKQYLDSHEELQGEPQPAWCPCQSPSTPPLAYLCLQPGQSVWSCNTSRHWVPLLTTISNGLLVDTGIGKIVVSLGEWKL